MLGLERDNDLWMRAHIGTRGGRKGSAPLGRNYFLSNWEMDKNVYNGFLEVKLSPLIEFRSCAMADPTPALPVLNCCLSTVQQLAVPVAQVRTALPKLCLGLPLPSSGANLMDPH